MDAIQFRLEPVFGMFPEPVIFLAEGKAAYSNEPGSALLEDESVPMDLLLALAEHPGDSLEIALGAQSYRATVSPYEGGVILVLRPLPDPNAQPHPFSNAIYRMRDCLSNFTAIQWQLKRALEARSMDEALETHLANQSRLLYQMLRMVRQAELTQELNDKSFPKEEGFDLAQVCQGMADETTFLADLAGVVFNYTSNVSNLPFKGSKSLLTQMLLALISNGVRAAGKEGSAEMKLHAENGRCVITVRDSGMGIPEDRMATLFSGHVEDDIPRPGEGAGLGLYNAQRIAAFHNGVLIAQSGQEGGTCLVVSLPIVTPPSVPARNNPGYDNLGGYSPVLIELSDMLPWQAFVTKSQDD